MLFEKYAIFAAQAHLSHCRFRHCDDFTLNASMEKGSCLQWQVFITARYNYFLGTSGQISEAQAPTVSHRCKPVRTILNFGRFHILSLKSTEVASDPRQPDLAERRFSELLRAMAKEESDAALAVFFNQSVTTIANWCNAKKFPRDIDELVRKCGISRDQLRLADEPSWQAAIKKVLKIKRVLITPGWLHFQDHISFVEESTRAAAIVILTADAYNDTQRLEVQDIVRKNISRGIDYIYVIPEGCQHERALLRFTGSINSGRAQGGTAGTSKILRTHTSKKTTRQWKRIDHVMLCAHGHVSTIQSLSDVLQLQIDEGYEQLYKAGDQPYGEQVWKRLSIREIDYYKELLEEWSSPGDDDEEGR